MNIETKWLEDFLSLARTQSFSRSAEERHMTQPAFSRRIKALETALECPLVDRTQVPIQLTAEGQRFQITANNLVSQLADCKAHLLSLASDAPQVIDFAVSHTLSLSFFPRFLQSLDSDPGRARYRQLVANVDDSIQALKNGICDFLLAFEDASLNSEQFQRLDLDSEQLIPVCQANDEGKPRFDLEQHSTAPIPYLGYPDEIYLGRQVALIMRNAPRTLRLEPAFESPLADSLKLMAIQGMGVAWVPALSVQQELQQGVLASCGGDAWRIRLQICLYRCKRNLSVGAETLWQTLAQRYGGTA